jgi:tRNA 2-thiouridine synthesizing protein A
VDNVLDLTGLKCPLPALLTRKALVAAAPGAVLIVVASDPLAVVDIPHMCNQEGHTVESVTHEGGRSRFHIRKNESKLGPD